MIKKNRKSNSVEKSYYESYNKNIPITDFYLLERERVMLNNLEGINILDIGCGTGKNGLLIRNKKLFGVDIYTNKNSLIKTKGYKKVYCIDISQKKIPLDDNSIDSVICMETLEHLTDPIHALSEANRVLKKNGNIIISVPNIGWIFSRIFHLFGIFSDFHDFQLVPSHIRFFTIKRMERLLNIMGYNIIKVVGTTDFVSNIPGQSFLNFCAKIYPSLFASNPVFIAKKIKKSKYKYNSYSQVSGLSQGLSSLITNK